MIQRSTPNRRRFYIITALVLVAILGVAVAIVVDLEYSYVKIQVTGNSETSFTISYDSTSTTLTPSENATVEVLPHASITLTANVTSPYTLVKWNVNGVTAVPKGNDTINFLTGSGGTTIMVSVEITSSTNSSA